MRNLLISSTTSSPAIHGDWDAGVLSMQGDSYPENSFELFSPVLAWVEDFLRDSAAPLVLELRLLYLNTSSIKAVMDIFDLLETAHHARRDVAVKWHYNPGNERVAEVAEEFKEDFSFPFDILAASHQPQDAS